MVIDGGGIVGAGFYSWEGLWSFSNIQVAVVHPERVTIIIPLGIPFMLSGIFILLMHLLPKGF